MPFDFGSEKLYPSTFEEENKIEEDVRFMREASVEGYQIRSPEQASAYLQEYVFNPFDNFKQEELYVLMLDNQKIITHEAMVYRGTINVVYIRMAELFVPAVACRAHSIVVAHNHPSGNPIPSAADISTTEEIVKAGKILDVECHDHIVIGKNTFTSIRQTGRGGFG